MAMLENDDDKEAYDSLTNRPPNEDLSLEGQAEAALSDDGDMTAAPPPAPPSLRQSVMDRISQNTGQRPPLENDPLLQSFDKNQAQVQDLRKAQMQANSLTNIGQAISQAAQGANAPVQDNSLFKNIEDQNKTLSRGAEDDLRQRQRVIQAIESRHWHEATPGSLATRVQTANDRHDRLLSGLDNKIQGDEILKPAQINLESLNKSSRILNDTSLPLTPQSLADAQQDITSALSLRPNALTEGKIKRTEMDAASLEIANLIQKYGNAPVDVRKIAPKLVEQVQKLNNVLVDDYTDTVNNRLTQRVNSQKTLISDPSAGARLDKYLQQNLRQKRQSAPSSDNSFPKQVRNVQTGKIATVTTADELKEANDEGFQ